MCEKSIYEETDENIEEAIELAQENGLESDYQILESDENGVLQTNDFLRVLTSLKNWMMNLNLSLLS